MYLVSTILFEESSFLPLTSLSSSGKWRLFHILPHFLNRDKWAARCCGRAIDLDRFWSLLDLDGFRSIFYSSVLILMGIWTICKICIQTKQFWVDYIVLSAEVYVCKILIIVILCQRFIFFLYPRFYQRFQIAFCGIRSKTSEVTCLSQTESEASSKHIERTTCFSGPPHITMNNLS